MIQFKSSIFILLIVFLFSSCDSTQTNRTCTDIFAISTMTVANQENEHPVESVQIVVKDQTTGQELGICEDGTCSNQEIEPGEYIIFHDGYRDDILPAGKKLTVRGTKGDAINFTREYFFGSDGCHIKKIAGPDTVFVSIGN
ncbi:MAG: hypothetical protein JXR26_08905 [Balneolaceae bacterium]|nr:hypothetical protein [Balneolaceae bacterium]